MHYLYVDLGVKVQQIDGLLLDVAVSLILQDDPRRVVPEQELLEPGRGHSGRRRNNL